MNHKFTKEESRQGGRKGGRVCADIHGCNRTREGSQKGAQRKQELHGDKTVEWATTAGKKGGPIAGRIAVESGNWAWIRPIGPHVQFHIPRNQFNPKCILCRKEQQEEIIRGLSITFSVAQASGLV